jgi:hypothetical protein
LTAIFQDGGMAAKRQKKNETPGLNIVINPYLTKINHKKGLQTKGTNFGILTGL